MTSTEPQDIDRVYWDAIQFSDPDRQRAYLDQACRGDAELRQRVEELLSAKAKAADFLESPPFPSLMSGEPPTDEAPGTQIGPYRLVEQIGEGGFGVVYLAEQERPVRRRVALKIIKPGMDTRQVIARFEAERQALALMDHPNIAKVLDAGTTVESRNPECGVRSENVGQNEIVGQAVPDKLPSQHVRQAQPDLPGGIPHSAFTIPHSAGRPYFVMELVHGVPITEYCDQCQLNTRERLELFISVCEAVQHAHQKGVIHRDIKPTNVLVAIQDGRPAPKIIDFGVAKAINQRLTEHTLLTSFVQMIGTPMYMSPEQAEMSQLGVDTRTDIYSLGVLLYELLTGTTPYEKERLHQAPFDEFRRILREEEPPRPSWRLSTLAADVASTVAQRRHTEPQRLMQHMRGELDWIIMKCLEKERNRRYETASGLAADLRHYLHDEPVQACPPSARYRLHKFARRNRVVLVTVSLVAAALIVGTVASALWAVRAIEAERLAAARLESAVEASRQADDARARAEASFQKARQAVDDMYTQVAERWLSQQPQMQPLQREFLEKALQFYTESAQRTGRDPAVRFETALAQRRMAEIQHRLGQPAPAESAFRQAVDRLQALADESAAETQYQTQLAAALHQLGVLLGDTGRYADELQAHRRALAISEELSKSPQAATQHRAKLGRAHWFVGQVLLHLQRRAEAETALRSALAIQSSLAAEDPAVREHRHHLAQTYLRLGLTLGQMGRRDDERRALGEAAAILERLSDESPLLPEYRNELANAYYWIAHSGQDSEEHLRRALALQEKLAAEYPSVTDYRYDLLRSQSQLGQLLTRSDRTQEAVKAFRAAAANAEKLVAEAPTVHYYRGRLALVQIALGELLAKSGKTADAQAAYEKAIDLLQALVAEFPAVPQYRPFLSRAYRELASLLTTAGRMDDAAAVRRAAELLGLPKTGTIGAEAGTVGLDRDDELESALPLPERSIP